MQNGTTFQNNEYWVGSIASSSKFKASSRGVLDFGMYYAARTGTTAGVSQSPTDRRIIFGATGWAPPRGLPGCQPHTSMQIELLPRDLALDQHSRLTITPIPELATLRRPSTRRATMFVTGTAADGVHQARGSLLELRLNCTGRPSGAGLVGLKVLMGPDGTFTTVGYNYTASELIIDHRHSSMKCPDRVTCGPKAIVQTAPLQGGGLGATEGVELVVMLDGGLVEAYLNRRSVMSVWIVEVMNSTAAGYTPADRLATAIRPPAGVSCQFESHELTPLVPLPS